MMANLARAMMKLTGACLGDGRRDWAQAMDREFEIAVREGKPFAFAIGCLSAALREMPVHAEGRFALASHAIALGLLPAAALLIVGMTSGFPFLPSGYAGISAWLGGHGEPLRSLTPWNSGFAPALALLICAIIAGHVLMPWFVLERDWPRVATLARVNSAATATLFLFSGALFLDVAFILLPAMALAIELSAVWLLYRWQSHIFAEPPPAASIA